MRSLALLALGIMLLALSGAFCRIFHLEWLHPDPVLLLDVFIALELPILGGGFLVFLLGLFSDSFAGTPMGMLASAHLLIWMVVRGVRLLLMPGRGPVRFGILFAMSLLFSLITMVQLLIMDAETGLIWVNLKAMLPLAILHLVLAIPLWPVARWVVGSSFRARADII